MRAEILVGDAREVLAAMPAGCAQTVVTSPPYFALRDYGTGEWEGGDAACDHRHETAHQQQGATSVRAGRSNVEAQRNENFRDVCGKCGARRVDRQIGLESTPDEYVAALVEVFREVRRVLRDDGTIWLNLGDTYNAYNGNRGGGRQLNGLADAQRNRVSGGSGLTVPTLKQKDLIGIPWMVAFALRADGWHLRADVIWAKPNPMPESVTDRPTKAHEYLFLLSKRPRYYYDAEAIRETAIHEGRIVKAYGDGAKNGTGATDTNDRRTAAGFTQHDTEVNGRNRRSVWTVATRPYAGAHFATFPPKLIEPCVLAGSRPGDLVLDPFAGAGTTGLVAGEHGREFVGVELNPEYAEMARARLAGAQLGMGV